MGVLGIIAFLGIAFLLSDSKRDINPRVVGSALALQIGIAVFVFYVPAGKVILSAVAAAAQYVIDYSASGIQFVFGELATDKFGFIIFARILPIVIFISALVAVLYHLRIMQWVVFIIGGALRAMLGVSRVESTCAAANIFLGHTESPLVVRPYLEKLSERQLFTIMVSGMASISGAMLAGYASLGVNLNYLLAAGFMAAPGGLLMAKIMRPDLPGNDAAEFEIVSLSNLNMEESQAGNIVEAAANGAAEGLKIAALIGAMLIAFVALVALVNGVISNLGALLGLQDLSLEVLLGGLFSPLMYLMGIPREDTFAAGNLVGQKLILTEFIAFVQLEQISASIAPRTEMIVTFALCGFANINSLAILLGGLATLAPSRKPEISRMGVRAIIAGTLSNLMSAAIASLIVTGY